MSTWAITGHDIDADTMRALAYGIFKDKYGPVGPADLAVKPLAVPGNGVRANIGQIVTKNRTKDRQDYFDEVSVEPTYTGMSASGPKYDMVVWEVKDFEAAGQGHPNLGALGPYGMLNVYTDIENQYGVDGDTVDDFDDLNVNRNAFGLAVVQWTGVGATVTSDMIRDIRSLAAPITEHFDTKRTVATDQPISSSSFMKWPTEADFTVRVPKWATTAKIFLHADGTLTSAGAADAELELRFGSTVVETRTISTPVAASVPGNFEIGDSIFISSAMRGQLLDLELWARDTGGASTITAKAGSKLNYDIRWGQNPLLSLLT